MAQLHRYKCKQCDFAIMSSEDGDYSLMSGPGHYYLCPRCKKVFRSNWSFRDIDLTIKDYSYEKDNALPYLLSKAVSEEFQEVFIKDVSWFQGEVIKGDESLIMVKHQLMTQPSGLKKFFGRNCSNIFRERNTRNI